VGSPVKKFRFGISAVIAAVLGLSGSAQAQFEPGNIVVERVGGTASFGAGASVLNGNATAVFLDQFVLNSAGQNPPYNVTALPTTASAQNPSAGTSLALTDSGSATSHGFLNRSTDGSVLLVSGYNANIGTASVATSNPSTGANRTIGILNPAAAVNTTTGFNNGPSGAFRSVASVSGSSLYASTNGGIYNVTTIGSVANATQITSINSRAVAIVNNSLFFSSASGANFGINLVGTAGTLPTGTATPTQLPGTGATGSSPYGFALVNNPGNTNDYAGTGLDTLYITDDSATATVGLSRWEFDGTTWNRTGTITFGTGTAAAARGLLVQQDGTNVTLVVTTGETSANRLIQLTDDLTSATPFFGASPITLATAPTNTAFRGVAFTPVPVPEPASILALAAGLVGVGGYVRRRVRRGVTVQSA
jgi:hypothetical protein